MRLGEALESIGELGISTDLSKVQRNLPHQWIEEGLRASGSATLRRWRLAAEQVGWLVIGMAILRNESSARLGWLLE